MKTQHTEGKNSAIDTSDKRLIIWNLKEFFKSISFKERADQELGNTNE